jgi:ribose transport system permease protein
MVAAAIGLLNGLCIKRLNMSPFVPTLASLAIARSLALIITRGAPDFDFRRRISGASLDRRRRHLRHSETFSYLPFSGDRWLILLSRTDWGRYVYAVGWRTFAD